MDDAAGKVQELVAGLGIKYGFERSFRTSARQLLTNRFLLGFRKQRLGAAADERILGVCERIGMPQSLLTGYREQLPDSQYVHFGFEENESTRLYKAYLEFYEKVEAQMRSQPGDFAPRLMHLGFKWSAGGDGASVLTRYTWHPFVTVESMLERAAQLFDMSAASELISITRAMLDAAAARVPHQDIFYLEATEDGNPRRSFDINMYRAKLRMEQLDAILDRLRRHYDLPAEPFRALAEDMRASIFGHISGGIDRAGKDFFTVYHGVEYREPAPNPSPPPAAISPRWY